MPLFGFCFFVRQGVDDTVDWFRRYSRPGGCFGNRLGFALGNRLHGRRPIVDNAQRLANQLLRFGQFGQGTRDWRFPLRLISIRFALFLASPEHPENQRPQAQHDLDKNIKIHRLLFSRFVGVSDVLAHLRVAFHVSESGEIHHAQVPATECLGHG